jgi:hypothetical protein
MTRPFQGKEKAAQGGWVGMPGAGVKKPALGGPGRKVFRDQYEAEKSCRVPYNCKSSS